MKFIEVTTFSGVKYFVNTEKIRMICRLYENEKQSSMITFSDPDYIELGTRSKEEDIEEKEDVFFYETMEVTETYEEIKKLIME